MSRSSDASLQSISDELREKNHRLLEALEMTKQLSLKNEEFKQVLQEKVKEIEEWKTKHKSLQENFRKELEFYNQDKQQVKELLAKLDMDLKQKAEALRQREPSSSGSYEEEVSRAVAGSKRSYDEKLVSLRQEYESQLASRTKALEKTMEESLQSMQKVLERRLKDGIAESVAAVEALKKEKDRLYENYEKIELENKTLESKLEAMKRQRDEAMTNRNQDRVLLYEELSTLGKSLMDAEEALKSQKKDNSRLASLLLSKDDEICSLKLTASRLQSEKENISSDREALTKENENLSLQSQTEKEYLENELEKVKRESSGEIARLTQQFTSMTDGNKKLEEQVSDLQRRLAFMNRELDSNRNKYRVVAQERELFQKASSDSQEELKALKQERLSQEGTLSDLREQIANHSRVMEDLSAKLHSTKQQNIQMEEKNRTLLADVMALQQANKDIHEEIQRKEEEWLKAEKELEYIRTRDGNPEFLSVELTKMHDKYNQLHQLHLDLLNKYRGLKSDAKRLKECAMDRKLKVKRLEQHLCS